MVAATAAITTIDTMSFRMGESYHSRVKAARGVSGKTGDTTGQAGRWPVLPDLEYRVPVRAAMIRAAVLTFAATIPLFAQTAASMLERLNGVAWEAPPTAACSPRIPVQMDIYATVQWTHHCSDTRDGVIRESFFYVFGEPARIALLRVDVRPVDESPRTTARLLSALQRLLTARFGAPTHEPEMMQIGFRPLRFGEPVAGDHWKGGRLHYFLHANLSAPNPMGVRRAVQLTAINDRLFHDR